MSLVSEATTDLSSRSPAHKTLPFHGAGPARAILTPSAAAPMLPSQMRLGPTRSQTPGRPASPLRRTGSPYGQRPASILISGPADGFVCSSPSPCRTSCAAPAPTAASGMCCPAHPLQMSSAAAIAAATASAIVAGSAGYASANPTMVPSRWNGTSSLYKCLRCGPGGKCDACLFDEQRTSIPRGDSWNRHTCAAPLVPSMAQDTSQPASQTASCASSMLLPSEAGGVSIQRSDSLFHRLVEASDMQRQGSKSTIKSDTSTDGVSALPAVLTNWQAERRPEPGFPDTLSGAAQHCRDPLGLTIPLPVVRTPSANVTASAADSAGFGSVRMVAARSEASFRCPRCGQGSFFDAQSAARHCVPSMSSAFNVQAETRDPNMPSRSTTVAYTCPGCGQTGFADAQSAARHCAQSFSTDSATPSQSSGHPSPHVQAETRAPNMPSRSTTVAYTCPGCGQTGFADAQSAARHCAQSFSTGSATPSQSSGRKYHAQYGAQAGVGARSASPVRGAARLRSGSRGRTPQPSRLGVPCRVSARVLGGGIGVSAGMRHHRDATHRPCSMPGLNKMQSEESLATMSTRSSQHHFGTEIQRYKLPDSHLAGAGLHLRKIERQIDEETGQAQTIVHNGDGTCTAFGESSLSTLCQSKEAEVKKVMDALSDLELTGLVHEFNQRLLKTADDYDALQKELDLIVFFCDLAFFGLTRKSSEKDLDQAYRKKARELHPDKNGNTDEAKAQFQNMKERYERLKERIRLHGSLDDEKPPEEAEADCTTAQRGDVAPQGTVPSTLPSEPIELPDTAGVPPDDDNKEEPVDRKKLEDACTKMVRRTKTFHEKIDVAHQRIEETKQELEDLQNKNIQQDENAQKDT